MGLLFSCSTAVTLLSLISLSFLIIAIITPPVTSSFGLAEDDSIMYGVLGYCLLDGSSCVTGDPFFKVSELTNVTDWVMDDTARDILAKILIVTPVAGFLTLLSLLFNLLCHFEAIGTSFMFNLFTFFFALSSFLSTAITTIAVFMCFYPHVKWPAWLLIPAGALTLISIPLAFFAMKTNPSSKIEDEDEVGYEHDLTDLSDGGLFKNTNESFKMNGFPQLPIKSSDTSEKIFHPVIKVMNDDSSSANDHFEKISAKDYSRTNNNLPFVGYKGYNLDSAPQHTTDYPTAADSDGTPNLVSAQSYNKVEAVFTEAPNFQPQSAEPVHGTTPYSLPYPSAAYATTVASPPSAPGISNKGNDLSSRNNSSALPVSPSGENRKETQTNIHSFSDSPQHPISDHPTNSTLIEIYNDYDDQTPDDNDSDFTSVSQRAANPKYYRGLQQNGPKLFPNQGRQQQAQPQQQEYYQPHQQEYYQPQKQEYYQPQKQEYYQPQQQQSKGYYPSQEQYGYQNNAQVNHYGSQPVGGSYSDTSQKQAPPRPAKDTSDMLLNTNPDFAIGGSANQRQMYPRRINQGVAGHGYKPAYKKLNQNVPKGLMAASSTSDSPYAFK